MANVRFVRTTKAKQISRQEYDNNALYFCTDSGELYRSNQLLSDGIRIVQSYAALPKFAEAADGIMYYTEDTQRGYVLNSTRDGWTQVIYTPVTDINAVPEGDRDSVVVTVEGLMDIIGDTKAYVDEKVASIDAGNVDGGEI